MTTEEKYDAAQQRYVAVQEALTRMNETYDTEFFVDERCKDSVIHTAFVSLRDALTLRRDYERAERDRLARMLDYSD